jgi:hypothetical protein
MVEQFLGKEGGSSGQSSEPISEESVNAFVFLMTCFSIKCLL